MGIGVWLTQLFLAINIRFKPANNTTFADMAGIVVKDVIQLISVAIDLKIESGDHNPL